MKILLVAINARFTHSNPAVYSLRQNLLLHLQDQPFSVEILEFNINQTLEYILGEVYHAQADLVGISCYIWNRRQALALAGSLKKVSPHSVIVLGGPEVSHLAAETLVEVPTIDYILRGEAELTFPKLLRAIAGTGELSEVCGLCYREPTGQIHSNAVNSKLNEPDLAELPFPYSETDLALLRDRIVYYETSRGCPYHCGYCLSAEADALRFIPLERVKAELKLLVRSGIKLVKFVDRTFNCNRERSRQIWLFLLTETPPDIRFHFEIGAELLDDASLDLLAKAPPGKFQFEVGVQSTTSEVLNAVARPNHTSKIANNIKRLAELGNIHLHLDLIAGLPLESWQSFAASFDEVYRMNPHRIQLGFLKVLPGTPIHRQAAQWGLTYQDEPPYEVLATPTLSYQDLWQLKRIEELVEVYGNTGRFAEATDYLISKAFSGSAFAFYADLAKWWVEQGYYRGKHKFSDYYDLLHQYLLAAKLGNSAVIDCLTLDFALSEQYLELPPWSRSLSPTETKNLHHRLAQDSAFISRTLPHLAGLRAREISKKTRLVFTGQGDAEQITLIDYTRRNPVTGRANLITLDNRF